MEEVPKFEENNERHSNCSLKRAPGNHGPECGLVHTGPTGAILYHVNDVEGYEQHRGAFDDAERARTLAEQALFPRIEAKLAEWEKNKLIKNAREEATRLNKEYDALKEKYDALKTETDAAENELILFEHKLNDKIH